MIERFINGGKCFLWLFSLILACCFVATWNFTAAGQDGQAEAQNEPAASATEKTASFFRSLELENVLLKNEWWRWAILLAAIFVGLAAGRIGAFVLRKIGRSWSDKGWEFRGRSFDSAASPLSLALLTVGLAVGLGQLMLSPSIQSFSAAVVSMLLLIALFWYAYNLVAAVEVALSRLATKTSSQLDDQLVPLARKTLRIFIVVAAVLVILEVVFKADVGAALAGLGIAGLAVSLAAQDSLKNLFGSITILFDQPFQIGDRIVFKSHDGVVEEIGFRSTKIRTLVGHVVTIPNSAIVNESVENIGRRPYLRRMIDLTITYDTPADKIEQAVSIVREILESDGIREPIHPTIEGNDYPPRVFFNDFKADSLNLFVIYWYAPVDWWAYMEHTQRVNLEIFRRFEQAGIEFAFPTQTLFLAGDEKRRLSVNVMSHGS